VVLLGVFFTLGYVVGRSSGPSTQPEIAKNKQETNAGPLEIPPAAAPAPTKPAAPTTPAPEEKHPVADDVKPSPVPEKKAPEAEKPAPKPADEKPAPVATSGAEPGLIEPAPGSVYVQIAATTRAEAFLVAESVGKKGHTVAVAQNPENKTNYRVLVGPLPPKDNTAIAKAKTDMEALGFKPFVRRFKKASE